MKILLSLTIISLIASFLADRNKTKAGIKKGMMMFIKILPSILTIIMLVSVLLYLIPNEMIVCYLGDNSGAAGFLIAAISGSIAMIPGFIAYPLAGMLVKCGVSYPVLSVFITTLMMVGIVTLPLEKKFFGLQTALIRNGLSLIGALVIGLTMALVWRFV